MPTNDKAYRIDHIDAMYQTIEYVSRCDVPRDLKLAALYGARMFAVSGGLPEQALSPLDSAISYYERNRSIHTVTVQARMSAEKTNVEETEHCGSGR